MIAVVIDCVLRCPPAFSGPGTEIEVYVADRFVPQRKRRAVPRCTRVPRAQTLHAGICAISGGRARLHNVHCTWGMEQVQGFSGIRGGKLRRSEIRGQRFEKLCRIGTVPNRRHAGTEKADEGFFQTLTSNFQHLKLEIDFPEVAGRILELDAEFPAVSRLVAAPDEDSF